MFHNAVKAAVASGVIALGATGSAWATSPVPGKPGPANIVQTAVAANQQTDAFDTLLAAATCDFFQGAIVDLLSGSDRYTLFAPTDDAFATGARSR